MSKNEILTIRLGYRKQGETRVGWVPGMSLDEIWAAGSAWWVLKASRAVECETLLILDPECVVIAVADVLGVRKEFKDASRFEILGDRHDEHEYLGKQVTRGKSQNPVAYVTPDQIV